MKKIFTLITLALMAVGVNAQKWTATADFAVSSGASVTSVEGVTLNIGNASDANTWSIADAAGDLGEGNDVLGTTNYIKGTENAKTGGKTTKANMVPETGTYYQFILSESGKLTVGVNWGKDKIMRLADADGSPVAEEKNETGASILDIREFAVPAGTYYLYAEGSKLGLFGFSFAKEEVIEDTGTPHEPQAWDFTSKLSDADKANIAADENWTISNVYVKDEEGNDTEEIKTLLYEYTQKFQGVPVTANGTELDLTKGLKFNTGASKFQYYDGERLAHGGNGHGPIIPECAKDDVVKIRYKVTEGGRGFEVANAEVTDGSLIADDKGTFEATVTVKKKGDVTFSSKTGADILALAVNTDLPDITDGISSVKTVEIQTVQRYNIAGQKVSANYKGITIQNGRKVLQK
ncbi:MAG: hypothetical protein IKX61_05775 [Prevotella sp.]|nr:hypothetical protein [Prevotella sp.]